MVTFATAITACGARSENSAGATPARWPEALQLLALMESRGVKPDAHCLCAAIAVGARETEEEEAREKEGAVESEREKEVRYRNGERSRTLIGRNHANSFGSSSLALVRVLAFTVRSRCVHRVCFCSRCAPRAGRGTKRSSSSAASSPAGSSRAKWSSARPSTPALARGATTRRWRYNPFYFGEGRTKRQG